MITTPTTPAEREAFLDDLYRRDTNNTTTQPSPTTNPPAAPPDTDSVAPTPTTPPSPSESRRQQVLRLALEATGGDRDLNYGHPEENFDTIANLWAVYLTRAFSARQQVSITPADVAQMMILVKVARLANTPNHFDSLVDIAGYAACHGELLDHP